MKTQSTWWFSSQELWVAWGKRKQRLALPANSGFSEGQIASITPAVATVTAAAEAANLPISQPLASQAATVFVSAHSSPVDRRLTREVFQKVGFSQVNLVAYTTALHAFAQRQAIRIGVGIYVGSDLSEGLAFSPKDQETFQLDHSFGQIETGLKALLREQHQLEITSASARQLYLQFGKRGELETYVVRGRNVKDSQITTLTLKTKALSALRQWCGKQITDKLNQALSGPLFTAAEPNHWVIVGDAFLNKMAQETYQANTIFLQSEFELIQGVQWL